MSDEVNKKMAIRALETMIKGIKEEKTMVIILSQANENGKGGLLVYENGLPLELALLQIAQSLKKFREMRGL